MVELFNVPVFFIFFRETLEASIILSVMLAVLHNLVKDKEKRRRMTRHVWVGVIIGVALSLAAGAVFISVYYTVAKDAWDSSEAIWEGTLSLIATILITIMAFAMIRVETWREKWEKKLTAATEASLRASEEGEATLQRSNRRTKYTLILLPLSVVLREGVEAIIFLGGVGLNESGTAVPIPAFVGALCGCLAGYLLYRGGAATAFRYFLFAATLLLLFIAAGLFTGAVHEFEEYNNTEHFIWQLHCCHEDKDGFWKIFNAIFGWRDEATIGTLSAYISYWLFVICTFLILRCKWKAEDAAKLAAESDRKFKNESERLEAGKMAADVEAGAIAPKVEAGDTMLNASHLREPSK